MSASAADRVRAVLITGASTGIGKACALELDRRAFRVFAGVRSPADGERLQGETSGRAIPVRIDVTDTESIAAARRTIAGTVGGQGLAGLVNNAGIVISGPLEILPLEQLRRQLEVNVIGQVAVTQAMLPLLRTARGRIVNLSSISGFVAAPYLGPYAASKFALEALSDSLRVELRRWGISVSLIEPGSVKTPIWDKALSFADQLVGQMSAQGEKLYLEDIEAMRRATVRLAETGMPVERVVQAVVHALSAPRPKTRYPLGAQTRLAALLLNLFPDRIQDAILCAELRLPQWPNR